jgi:MSHA biogenesis protein MshO
VQLRRRSPVDRVYVGEDPVSFCIEDGDLYRYAHYGLAELQCTPDSCLPGSAPGRARLGENIDNAGLRGFTLLEPTLRRNGIVRMELNFTEAGDTVRLNHELMMRNVP